MGGTRRPRGGLLARTRLAEWVGRGPVDEAADSRPAPVRNVPAPAGAHDTGGAVPDGALQYLVDHDQLTGLRNRHGFERVLDEYLPSAGERPCALIKLGIDNFRHLNAGRGRQTCDIVLTTVANIVASAPGAAATARIEGDTFGLLLPGATGEEACATASDLLAAVREAGLGPGAEGIRATMSAGVAVLDREDLKPADALLEADLAMAVAKEEGRDRVAMAAPAERRPFRVILDWAEAIRAALENDSLALHCQPLRPLRGGSDRWELLLRLPQTDGQLLPPAAFLPTAERFGLVERVDEWVLGKAIALLVEHDRQGRRVELEINLSAQSLLDGGFVDHVTEQLERFAVDPARLTFEVNEVALDRNLDEARLFASRLKDLGCRFVLDNFGTRHASLAHLKALPIDGIKIDGTFVRHMADDAADRSIVRALIELAHELGLEATAMFVADAPTLELLEEYGVDHVQGFHIGKPRPVAELA